MNKRQLILVWIVSSLLSAIPVLATDIPQELGELGFTEDVLISHDKEGFEEFFTFWFDKERGDTITFIVEDGKIKQKTEGDTAKFSEK
ncbi:MAG: hypothetical protein Q8O30_00725 [Candidatus Omnitrophota bacterium]|nr:hypothetical protein [Candidatus Omnitrophota bacterium]